MRAWWWLAVITLGWVAGCNGGGAPPADVDGGRDAALPRNEPCDTPGTLETVPCGLCGTVSRFCTAGRIWEYGVCEGERGVCAPGEERDAACGACGTRREVCTTSCAWEAVGPCESEGMCSPGDLVRTREGCASGQRDLRCSDSCVLEPVSECEVDTCTTPGAIERVSCGMCGTRERFCAASGEWQYGPCEGQGGCMPGTSEEVACGACGTQTMRCTASCEWLPSGSCSGEGECAPGTTTRSAEGCEAGQTRPLTCSETCHYEPAGACSGGSSGGGARGQTCDAGRCESGLVCHSVTGIDICRRPCSTDAECGSGSWCLGDGICSDVCAAFLDTGCPAGAKCDYLGEASSGSVGSMMVCSAVGSGRAGAACTLNSQCARGFSCVLDSGGTSGRCTQVCDATHPCPTGQTCGGSFPFPIPITGLGFCG